MTRSARLALPVALSLFASILSSSFTPLPAHADVAPPACSTSEPDIVACNGKKAGDACTATGGDTGTAGNCAVLRCATDGGQAPLKCVTLGAAPSGSGGCAVGPGGPAQAPATAGLFGAAFLGLGLLALRRARGRATR